MNHDSKHGLPISCHDCSELHLSFEDRVVALESAMKSARVGAQYALVVGSVALALVLVVLTKI